MTDEDWLDRQHLICLSAEITLKHVLCYLLEFPGMVELHLPRIPDMYPSVASFTFLFHFSTPFPVFPITSLNKLLIAEPLSNSLVLEKSKGKSFVLPRIQKEKLSASKWWIPKQRRVSNSRSMKWWTTESPLILTWLLQESWVVVLHRNMNKKTSSLGVQPWAVAVWPMLARGSRIIPPRLVVGKAGFYYLSLYSR